MIVPAGRRYLSTRGGTISAAVEDLRTGQTWDLIGGSAAAGAYNAAAGPAQTAPDPDGYWGESTTSAADQIRLLGQLVLAHGLLHRASQRP